MTDRITVYACWERARREYPGDSERRKMRFVELLRSEGHVVKKKPGEKSSPLFSCGYDPRKEARAND